MRGSSIPVRRSLRVRVIAAATSAFAGLAAMVCLLLPYTYARQARESFRNDTIALAQGIALSLESSPVPVEGTSQLPDLAAWARAIPHLDAVLLMNSEGAQLARWPGNAPPWKGPIPATGYFQGASEAATFLPFGDVGNGPRTLAVLVSADRLTGDLQNARWLFLSIFLFLAGVFVVLTRYLSNSIVEPLEQIGRAAMDLADGEPVVEVPRTGDREIDELGEFISQLGANRRRSTVMAVPQELLRNHAAVAATGADAKPDSTKVPAGATGPGDARIGGKEPRSRPDAPGRADDGSKGMKAAGPPDPAEAARAAARSEP